MLRDTKPGDTEPGDTEPGDTRTRNIPNQTMATLQLDPARTALISGFVDTYLRLNQQEEQAFQVEIGRMDTPNQEGVMQIVTSWMAQGIEQGIERERSLVLRQLTRRVGELPTTVQAQIQGLSIAQVEDLGEALLDFSSRSELEAWLSEQNV